MTDLELRTKFVRLIKNYSNKNEILNVQEIDWLK